MSDPISRIDYRQLNPQLATDVPDYSYFKVGQSPINPGGNAACVVMAWDDGVGDFVDTDIPETVYDQPFSVPNAGRNFYMPGEIVKARRDPYNGRWTVDGSFGLRRRAVYKGAQDWTFGTSQSVLVYWNGAESTVALTVSYDWTNYGELKQNTRVWIEYIADEGKWVVAGTDLTSTQAAPTLFRAVLTDNCHQPGTSATYDIKGWDGAAAGGAGDWVTVAAAQTVRDTITKNFLAINEDLWVVRLTDTVTGAFVRYETIAQVGTQRRGKAVGDIAANTTGSVRVYMGGGQDACDGQPMNSQCDVVCCNDWGDRRKLWNNDEICVFYDVGTQRWYPDRDDRTTRVIAALPAQTNMCPDDTDALINTATVQTEDFVDSSWGAVGRLKTDGAIKNLWGHAARDAGTMALEWDETAQVWWVADVDRDAIGVVTDVLDAGSTCPDLNRTKRTVALEYCEDDSSQISILPFDTQVLVESVASNHDVPGDACTVETTTRNICVPTGSSANTPTTAITLNEVDVVESIAWDNVRNCEIYNTRGVWVMCNDALHQENDAWCGYECPPPSQPTLPA